MKYKIVVDTSCDVQPGVDSGFSFIPFGIDIGDHSFFDDEKTTLELVKMMREEPAAAKSSCPSPAAYAAAYECNAQVIFVVTISSNLSGSFNSAKLAREIYLEENSDKEIYLVDSLSAAAGETAVAHFIKNALDSKLGYSTDKLYQDTLQYANSLKTLFVLDDLSNLVKNGRMGKIAGMLASFLQIKPVLGDDGNGEIVLYKKSRGSKKALKDLIAAIGERGQDLNLEERILYISHCNAPQKASKIKELVEAVYSFAKIEIFETSGLSTVYAGDGGIVIAF